MELVDYSSFNEASSNLTDDSFESIGAVPIHEIISFIESVIASVPALKSLRGS